MIRVVTCLTILFMGGFALPAPGPAGHLFQKSCQPPEAARAGDGACPPEGCTAGDAVGLPRLAPSGMIALAPSCAEGSAPADVLKPDSASSRRSDSWRSDSLEAVDSSTTAAFCWVT